MQKLTPEQVKGRIKNAAKQNHADPRTLMRIYMMERFTGNASAILQTIHEDIHLRSLWEAYQKKYSYAADIQYEDVINSAELLWNRIDSAGKEAHL